MARITNLNRVRKDRARAEKRAKADQNAVRHGMTKAEKQRQTAQIEQARRHLDGKRREDD